MRKVLSVIIAVVLLCSFFVGCSSEDEYKKADINVVTTVFAAYDWIREIAKGNNNLQTHLLNDSGVDMHSYQPTVADIVKVSECDIFIYVGGESDKWVEDALKESVNENQTVINLIDLLKDEVKYEQHVEGMQSEFHQGEIDDHVWLSLKNAETVCREITDRLSEIDGENRALYEQNAEDYIGRLQSLDDEYEKVVNKSEGKTVLFADRFPFRYLTDCYGINYYAAFAGCSAETEASFETVTFLANKIDELNLSCVLVTEGSDKKIAQTVISSTADKNQQILSMDSLQSVKLEDGKTYISIMKNNLEVLKEALW